MTTLLTDQPLFEQLLADPTLDAALAWHAETIDQPLDRTAAKAELRARLATGEYAFSPLRRVHTAHGPAEQWTQTDRILLNALTLVLHGALGDAISPRVHHLRDGAGAALSRVQEHLAGNPGAWVLQADLAGLCERIDHGLLYARLAERLPGETYLLRLLWQYLHHAVEEDGAYRDVEQGLARGCALSPLLAALYLQPLDALLEEQSGCYARHGDDWVALFPTRWAAQKTRDAVGRLMADLGLDGALGRADGSEPDTRPEGARLTHPTPAGLGYSARIGRAARGFELLGRHLTPETAAPAGGEPRGGEASAARRDGPAADSARIRRYRAQWRDWVQQGPHAPAVVARPARRSPARKRLAQIAAGGAGLLGCGASFGLIQTFSVTAVDPDGFSGSNAGHGGANVSGVSMTADAYFAPAGGGGFFGVAAVTLRRSLLLTGPDIWRFYAGTGGGTIHPATGDSANGPDINLSAGPVQASSTAGVLSAIGSATQNVYFLNSTGAGWAILSYDASTLSASVTGALNPDGSIVFGTTSSSVPEPAPLALLTLGAAAGLPFARRRRRAARP